MTETRMTVKGYKTFDENLRCKGFQYEIGQTYSLPDGEHPVLCARGFHFCERAVDAVCWPGTRYAEVEAEGEVLKGTNKAVCSVIRIVREVSKYEMYALVNEGGMNMGLCNNGQKNTGAYNEGSMNSGNLNIGKLNAGHGNIGDGNTGACNYGSNNAGNYNLGDGNTGWWNCGDKLTGFMNNTPASLRMFNKETDTPIGEIVFPDFFYRVKLCWFVPEKDMTPAEKTANPSFNKFGGVLRCSAYREAWQAAFKEARKLNGWPLERKKLLSLPNFNFTVFEQITGISKTDILTPTDRQGMLEDSGIPLATTAYACAENARRGWHEAKSSDHKLEHAATLLGRTIRDAMYAGCKGLDVTANGAARPLWHRLFKDLSQLEFQTLMQFLEEKGYKVSYDWQGQHVCIEFVCGHSEC